MAVGEEAKAATSYSAEEVAEGTLDTGSNLPFQCCVCLDLIYKPVVLACGHISCFWCVHKAMHGLQASHCAICRRPYKHFPSICLLLHFLILKLEPVAYKKRGMEVLEEERKDGVYSPQFMDQLELEKFNFVKGTEDSTDIIEDNRQKDSENLKNTIQEKNFADDLLCSLCKELLYRPVVLNCGHVFCESCQSNQNGESLRCQICQSLHPGGFPSVCFDLDHFIEEQFQREYAVRREQVQLKKAHYEVMNTSHNEHDTADDIQTRKSDVKFPTEDMDQWFNEDMAKVHVGVGCDSCGVYPINGKRYKCLDCKEDIGFDLCEACYNTTSKLPGRFNQQHTPDHKFALDDSMTLRNILLQANHLNIREQEMEVFFVPTDDDSGDHENLDNDGADVKMN